MSDDVTTNETDTPWEFYPDDDLREEPGMAAEDSAMHIEFPDRPVLPLLPETEAAVVHYLEDEDPEVPDTSLPKTSNEVTPGVEELLIRQHYMDS